MAAKAGHKPRRIAMTYVSIWSCQPFERLIAAGFGFVSRKVWKLLPWSALIVKCVNAVKSTWCSISLRYSMLLSSVLCRQTL